jgi:hypothetical protein
MRGLDPIDAYFSRKLEDAKSEGSILLDVVPMVACAVYGAFELI